MFKFILKRAFYMIPVFVAISLITFLLMHITPGGPWDAFAGGKIVSAATKKQLAAKYGLDQPLPEQYIKYVTDALHGDFGPAYFGPRTVNKIIADGFPVTAALGLFAVLTSIIVGIPLGVLAALRHNKALDHVVVFMVTTFHSVPNFILGLFMLALFSVNLHWFPTQFDKLNPISWIMPVGLLALASISSVTRLTRSSVLEVLGQDYIRTARAKGLSPMTVNWRHVLRNALIPIVTFVGPLTADLITGSFVVETMFGVPGIGREFVTSITKRDYAILMGVTLLYAFVVVFFNLAVDLTYSFLDPRITHG